MKIKYFDILVAMFLVFVHTVQAQVFIDNEFDNFEYNVKQIDEFILRFNLKELLITPDKSSQYERDNRILLFDRDYYISNSNNLNEFLNSAEEQNTILSFYDSTWYAIAECNVTFKGRKDKISLILRVEQVKDDIYKWSIIDAQGSILELTPKTQSDRLRLLPTDNEVNFIALQSITTDNFQNITLFNEKKHETDRLSVFNCLVYNKLLKINNIQDLSYCFTQVRGYKFFVKYFTRNKLNAGWLIYDVHKETPKYSNRTNNDSIFETSKQKVFQLYSMLSNYAKNPTNISLAKTIQSLFHKESGKYFFFNTMHIYDDINVAFHNYSPIYAYTSISDYINSIDRITQSGIELSYHVDDFNIFQGNDGIINVTYKLSLKDKNNILYEYQAKAMIQGGFIVSIVPL